MVDLIFLHLSRRENQEKKLRPSKKSYRKLKAKCKFTLENLDYISLDVLINKMEESFHNIYIYQFIMMYILNIILSVIP